MVSVYSAIKEAYAEKDFVVAEAAAKKLMRAFADAKLFVREFNAGSEWHRNGEAKSRIVFFVDGVKVTIEDGGA